MSKKICILIAFNHQYINPKIYYPTPLPGVVIDLYLSYQQCLKMNPDQIYVITDINKDVDILSVTSCILENIVSIDILKFITNLKHENKHYLYTNKQEFINILTEILTYDNNTTNNDDDKIHRSKCDQMIFLYYSGHGKSIYANFKRDYLIYLPIKEHDDIIVDPYNNVYDRFFSISKLYNILLDSVSINSQIFILFDSCYTIDLRLPYFMDKGVYHLTSNDNKKFIKPEIVFITSSNFNQKSYLINNGSIFTRLFFQYINSLHHYQHILDKIHKVSPIESSPGSIYSSSPLLKYIWLWLISSTKSTFRVDHQHNILYYYPE